jgi:hypothetical protein
MMDQSSTNPLNLASFRATRSVSIPTGERPCILPFCRSAVGTGCTGGGSPERRDVPVVVMPGCRSDAAKHTAQRNKSTLILPRGNGRTSGAALASQSIGPFRSMQTDSHLCIDRAGAFGGRDVLCPYVQHRVGKPFVIKRTGKESGNQMPRPVSASQSPLECVERLCDQWTRAVADGVIDPDEQRQIERTLRSLFGRMSRLHVSVAFAVLALQGDGVDGEWINRKWKEYHSDRSYLHLMSLEDDDGPEPSGPAGLKAA